MVGGRTSTKVVQESNPAPSFSRWTGNEEEGETHTFTSSGTVVPPLYACHKASVQCGGGTAGQMNGWMRMGRAKDATDGMEGMS